MEKYIHWLQQQGKSEHTIRRYKTVLKEFQQWYEEMTGEVPFDPQNVSAVDLQDWKNYLINIARIENPKTGEKKLAISTVNNKIESLKAYFRYLYDTGAIKDNPASSLSVQKQQMPLSPRWLERVEKINFCITSTIRKSKRKICGAMQETERLSTVCSTRECG